MTPAPVRRRWRTVDGVLLLDKPSGLTSNHALQRARRLFCAAKGGHTGTLDPMATGLLPLCFGEATKFSNRLLDADKTYLATVCLGTVTTTGDAEGEVVRRSPVQMSDADVVAVCARFRGVLRQVPPMYSALKHNGRALYEYARAGVDVEREEREIRIHALDVLRVEGPLVDIRVHCSKGTYVRTLAEDIGIALGCGAHLTALRRIAIGTLDVADALSFEVIEAMSEESRATALMPTDSLLLHLPAVALGEDAARVFVQGQAVGCQDELVGEVRVYGKRFLGLGAADGGGRVRPVRVIASGSAAPLECT